MLEDILRLMQESDIHKKWTVNAICNAILPAIKHNRIRFWVDKGKIVGFVTFTYLTKEQAKAYVEGKYYIQPDDFKRDETEGDLWGLNFVAPYGHARAFAHALKKEFKGKSGNAYRFLQKRVGTFHGARS